MVKNGFEWTNGINCFTCCYDFMQVKRWFKISEVGMVKNGCDKTLKLTVFEEWADWINQVFTCWHRFAKVKS